MAENGHYWQVEGKHASAQMIDNILTDLSDILVEMPPQGKDTVVRVPADPEADPGSKAARDHYALGEGGINIEADEDEIVTGDGQGGVKAHSHWFGKIDDDDFDGANTLTIDNSREPQNQPVIISGTKTGTVRPLSSNIPRPYDWTGPDPEFQSQLPKLTLDNAHVTFKNTFVKVDNAEIQVSENAILNIDGNGTSTTVKTGTTRQVNGPQLLLHDNIVIEMNPCTGTVGSGQQSPYIGINGPFFLQVSAVMTGGGAGTDWTSRWSPASVMQSRWGRTTWLDGYRGVNQYYGYSGPYISFGGNPSIDFGGNANVQIHDSACLLMEHNGAMKLDQNAFIEMTYNSSIVMHDLTEFWMEGASRLMLTGSAGLEIGNNFIFLTSTLDSSQNSYVYKPGGNDGHTTNVWGTATNAVLGQWGAPQLGVVDSMFDSFCNTPSLYMGGSTIIETSDTGKNAFRFGGKGSMVYMVEPEGNSKVLYKFAPQGIFNFTVQGNSNAETWFKYNPLDRIYVNIQPQKSILAQIQPQEPWEIYFEGGPGLIQVQGASHIENHGGTHILRNNSNGAQNAAKWSHSSHYTSTGNLTFKTKNQYTAGDNLDTLVANTADFLAFKNKLNENVPNTAYANKYGYDGGGEIVSSEPDYTENVYTTRIHGADGTYTGTFTTDYYTTGRNSLFYYLKSGNKVPPNCTDQGTGTLTYQYRSGNTYYYKATGVKYTHDGVEFKLNNEYPAGTPLSSLSADDKEIMFGSFNQDISNASVVSSQVRSDMTYTTTITGYKTIYGHNGRDWAEPVLPYDGNPVSQMYDESNFLMRAETIPYASGSTTTTVQTSETDYEYTLVVFTGSGTTADPYLPYFEKGKYYTRDNDGRYNSVSDCPSDWGTAQNKYYRKTTDQERYDKFMANTTDYNAFLSKIAVPLQTYENLQILGVTASQSGTPLKYYITVSWNATKKEAYSYLPSSNGSPIIEMVGTSELRLRGGVSIKGTMVNGEGQFEFSDGNSSVTLSMSDLAYLKSLIPPPV